MHIYLALRTQQVDRSSDYVRWVDYARGLIIASLLKRWAIGESFKGPPQTHSSSFSRGIGIGIGALG
jgi:hypothetical protein